MNSAINDTDIPILYIPKFREYGLQILDGGSSFETIQFCPWCGSALPTSKRDAWFERLDELGLEPEDEGVPEAMQSDTWWKQPH